MKAPAEIQELTAGELANNGMFVQGLQKLLMGSEYNLEVLVRSVRDMKVNGSWRAFSFQKYPDQVFRWNASDFRKFIEAERPAGCQTPLYILERLLRGTDAWETLQELIRGEPGGANNPFGCKGKPEENGINYDNITVDSSPPPPTGTSVSYALRRLKREREDLYERVKAGELTSNAAMVEAGFREKSITIPADPKRAAQRIVRHFSLEQFNELVDEALSCYHAEGEVADKPVSPSRASQSAVILPLSILAFLPSDFQGDPFGSAWENWQAHRREQRLKAYKERGLKALAKKLAAMGPERAVAAIEHSIAQNYQGIFEPRGKPESQPKESSTASWYANRTGTENGQH